MKSQDESHVKGHETKDNTKNGGLNGEKGSGSRFATSIMRKTAISCGRHHYLVYGEVIISRNQVTIVAQKGQQKSNACIMCNDVNVQCRVRDPACLFTVAVGFCSRFCFRGSFTVADLLFTVSSFLAV